MHGSLLAFRNIHRCARGVGVSSKGPCLVKFIRGCRAGSGVNRLRSMAKVSASNPKFTNALVKEESPYLLQHAHNPVDWMPWGEDAFQKARKEDKPIFLSVGYSTCHWCHVMEKESFEDEPTAKIMNSLFVNVKVDREERPDVDKVYMTYIQAISGSGGWPMSVFLTPDLKPIFGGTYFPAKERYGMSSFQTLLQNVSAAWKNKRTKVIEQGDSVMEELAKAVTPSSSQEQDASALAGTAMTGCADSLGKRFDSTLGGFGGAPKFPRPCEMNALLRQYLRKKVRTEEEAKSVLHMVEYTLERMATGGIYDHVGGGFHRYSVDEHWHVPHFEKMLYDNPQVATTYINAFQISGNNQWAFVIRGILDYMRRDLMHPEGGFYSAEDADSLDPESGEKGEGYFYVWKASEIEDILGDKAAAFMEHYYVKPGGNCDLSSRSDPHKEFVGKNCLIAMQSIAETASDMKLSESEASQLIGQCRKLLHEKRATRPRPGLDDKVVSGWNGMAISALALASRILSSEDPPVEACFPVDGVSPNVYLEAAQKAAAFLQKNLWDSSTGLLRRSFCRGPSVVEGFADDYADVIAAMLDLYEASGDVQYLQFASKLQIKMDELFWDKKEGGYFSTSGEDPSILLRVKDDYDGAEPTASSVALGNLLRLGGFFNDDDFKRKGDMLINAFSDRLQNLPIGMPQMAAASYLLEKWPLRQVVVLGNKESAELNVLLDAVHTPFAPDKVVILLDPADTIGLEFWQEKNPQAVAVVGELLDNMEAKPTVFICQNFACQTPTSNPDKVVELLSAGRQGSKPQAVDIGSILGNTQ